MSFRFPVIFAAIGSLGLAACEAPQTFDPNNPNQRTKSGAVVGAVSGAMLGAITGDGNNTLNRAVTGAVIGAGVGAITGNILDRQAAELQRDITTNGVSIINQGDRLVVSMPDGILFAVDSAVVQPAIMGDLSTVANSLNRYPNSIVKVFGHTDNTGSAAHNQELSLRRAQSVTQILQSRGVSASRLAPIGQGENQPIASNLTPEGRAQNRRVEIVIIPTK